MGVRPPFREFATGRRTPLRSKPLPTWADPRDREENIHHILRRLLETNDWTDIEVYGPEVLIQHSPDRIFVDVLLHVKPPGEEVIGIEVKQSADAFERTSNLDQLKEQAETGVLDRLYACTPQTSNRTRLDIDPTATQLIQQLEWGKLMMAFRRLEGTIQLPDGRELSKGAFYGKRRFKTDREKLVDRAKREGDWEQIEQNLEEYDDATLGGGADWDRGNEWLHDVLKQIGILRVDLDSGEFSVQKEMPEHLSRSQKPARLRQNGSIDESDVVHALWNYYVEKPDTVVTVEVEPPSLERTYEPNRIQKFLGERESRSAPRPDMLVMTEARRRIGVEVKGGGYETNDLFDNQLPRYLDAEEFDEVVVAVSGPELERTLEIVDASYPEVGVISVQNPRGDREIERVR